jgi:hypothetical protein
MYIHVYVVCLNTNGWCIHVYVVCLIHYYTTLQNRILKVNVMYSHRAVTVTCHHEGHPNDKHPLGYTQVTTPFWLIQYRFHMYTVEPFWCEKRISELVHIFHVFYLNIESIKRHFSNFDIQWWQDCIRKKKDKISIWRTYRNSTLLYNITK